MTYKTILVHIDHGKRCPTRLDLAARLAKRFAAQLVGLHAVKGVHIPSYIIAETGHILLEEQRNIAATHAEQAEALFRRAGAELPDTEWKMSSLDPADAVTLHGRYADLVVLGQPEREERGGVSLEFADRVVLSTGRPVLVVPSAGQFESLGSRVLVAWNATRESARATTDALPFLTEADEVQVISVNAKRPPHGEEAGADIGAYLARHGVRVKVANIVGAQIDAGDELLAAARDASMDLIVMGAYGHSRLAELVLGGVTRTMLSSTTVPVLMSH